jgi:multidrug efflux system membrane fusion protein
MVESRDRKKSKRSPTWRRNAAVVAAVSALLVAAGCDSNQQKSKTALAVGPPPPPVTVALAKQENVPIEIHAIGTGQPYRTVDVKPQVNGQIQSVLFHQGDFVRKGQILFQLDKRPFQAALDQALGNLAKDKANAADQRAQANRDNALYKAGVIALQLAQQQEAQAQSAAAAVQADEAAVETARVNLSYTDIKAPIDGMAGAILVNIGNVVQANSSNPLTIINQISPMYVQFSIPEGQLPNVQKYRLGTLDVQAYPPNQPTAAEGKLTFINNTVDPTTGTIQLMGTFPNTNRVLWPGEFLNVVLQLGTESNAVVVPADAVQTGQQGNYVFVVQPNGTAAMKPVKTSRDYRGLAVIQSGVVPGEKVIVNGQIKVIPNGQVNVVKTIPTVRGREQTDQPGSNQAVEAQNGGGANSGGPQ